jgi:hypothetical protein
MSIWSHCPGASKKFFSIRFSKLVVILDQLAINRYPIISIYPGEEGDGGQRIGADGLA